MQMEEKAFVSSLHSYMKDRGTPIERIPHLGFKQSECLLALRWLFNEHKIHMASG